MQIKTPLTATKYRADDATLRDATGRVIGTMRMADAEALAAPGAVVQAGSSDGRRLTVTALTGQGWNIDEGPVPVLYTDTINGQQVGRDDVFLCKTEQVARPSPQDSPSQTEAQVAHAARALADRHALACNVNKDDNWRVYGEEFTADARFVLDAARGAA